jgi:ubiquinone/menaquinone biosynthesis C-methylase UbiE
MAVRASNSKERFSSRVEAYAKYRPGYPPGMYALFRNEMGVAKDSAVADVGSGTGLSAEPLLKDGVTVHCVEPNADMRAAAEAMLGKYPSFRSVDGSGEQTNLPGHAVDLVFCAQAFHWLDHAKATAEFKRICKPGGHVAIVWNKRKTKSSPFLAAYEDLLERYGTDYTKVAHERVALTRDEFSSLFGTPFTLATFENAQRFDLEGLRGRVASSSYTPTAGEKGHAKLFAGLDELFAKFAQEGRVAFEYDTEVFHARLPA